MPTPTEYLEAFHDEHTGMINGGPLQQHMEAGGCGDAEIHHVLRAAEIYNSETMQLDNERLARAIFDAHCEAYEDYFMPRPGMLMTPVAGAFALVMA